MKLYTAPHVLERIHAELGVWNGKEGLEPSSTYDRKMCPYKFDHTTANTGLILLLIAMIRIKTLKGF